MLDPIRGLPYKHKYLSLMSNIYAKIQVWQCNWLP